MRITYLDGRPDEVVEDYHFRVDLKGNNPWNGSWWRMSIDLTEMCETVGKKVKDWDTADLRWVYYVDYPVSRFKKTLKLIHRYADDDQQDRVQEYLDANYPKWAAEFRKLR